MKDKVLEHIGSLTGGLVHNLNTPLMWVMGRAQLIQARNERLSSLESLSPEELETIRDKNTKDLQSILEGADKIDAMLKALSYKAQLTSEGYASMELKEYLEMETSFLMSDMRFKHETRRELHLDARTCYVKVHYPALSAAVTGVIDTILTSTDKGRSVKISLDSGIIRIACPEMQLTEHSRERIETLCRDLRAEADILVHDEPGFEISIAVRNAK
ncbi:MAG: hypothetical protein RRA35_10795 [Desulfomonilia bacterium]|nr:hypothetical protein [Desulfomonilia bacterium]